MQNVRIGIRKLNMHLYEVSFIDFFHYTQYAPLLHIRYAFVLYISIKKYYSVFLQALYKCLESLSELGHMFTFEPYHCDYKLCPFV